MTRSVPGILALATVVLLVAACSGGGSPEAATESTTSAEPTESGPVVVRPGAPGQPATTLSADELDELEPASHTEADVAFMQGMIHHHEQALQMVALIEGRSQREDLPLMAERLRISQEDEIVLMKRWLEERDEELPTDHETHGGELMPGMLSEVEMDELRDVTGRTFDRRFLAYMIRHHVGALTMVDDLFAAGGGLEPASNQFALHVRSDQPIEIRRMEELLATIADGG